MKNNLQTLSSVAVVGASGGIGSEFVRQFHALDNVERVFAFARRAPAVESPRVTPLPIDLEDESSIKAAAASIDAPLDAVIIATGLLHNETLQPEKRLQDVSADALLASYKVNAVGPVLVAKHFLPLLRPGSPTLFAVLSARVGSISDNHLGGWASYRASKAALNMLLRTAAIEHRRRRPESIIAALHPGTVDTPLSAPFQDNVPNGKLFTPAFAVERLLAVLDELQPGDSGGFFAWDGQAIDF